MKEDRRRKEIHIVSRLKQAVLVLVFALALGIVLPANALAQCETAGPSNAAMDDLVASDIDNINLFIVQEENFINQILSTSAFDQLANRFQLFTDHFEAALTDWWKQLFDALKGMTKELHIAQVDQTRALGGIIDAQFMVEENTRRGDSIINAHRRYAPSELACEIDTAGPGQSKAFQISRALNRGLALDDAPRHENAAKSISAAGQGHESDKIWQEYVQKFCDNTMGDQGCTAPGTIAGRHKDIPELLWGSKQTIDPSNPDNLLTMQAALRYLVNPLSSDPVPPKVVKMTDGYMELMARHSELAYTNTIYNTMGGMLSERIGGSGVNAQLARSAAGINQADASTDASYRELQEMMTRDRYNNPEYIVRMIENPEQVAREQGTLNALRLQTLNDIYRRSEEMLFMEAAAYSRDLDMQRPGTGISSMRRK